MLVLERILDVMEKLKKFREPQGRDHNTILTLNIMMELMIKSKKKVLGGLNGSFLKFLVRGGYSLIYI